MGAVPAGEAGVRVNVRPWILDLFCGAGGAAVGYHRAGFEVLGVDIEPQPHYPFQCVVADALDVLIGRLDSDGLGFTSHVAAVHASPPCQAYTQMSAKHRGHGGVTDTRVGIIDEVRDLLRATGLPYVIENVMGAKTSMEVGIVLHGGMFGLGVDRPRLFESNMLLMQPKMRRLTGRDGIVGVYGRAPDGRRLWGDHPASMLRAAASLKHGADAMGIDWMPEWHEITEAIPPAYTEFIGSQLLEHLAVRP